MSNLSEHLEDISEIRQMMERHSKFLSLSGLSGISAGIFGLLGAAGAWYYIYEVYMDPSSTLRPIDLEIFLGGLALAVLVCALGSALFFSLRMARQKDLPIWNKTAKRTLMDMAIPLIAGGLFIVIQLYHGAFLWVGASTLLFYGLSLLNASRNTLPEIRYLAFSEIALGLLCGIWVGHSLLFWAIGFGVLHIVYGAVMYFKYER